MRRLHAFTVGDVVREKLNAWLDSRGLTRDYDPFLPPLELPKWLTRHSTHTPGTPYPPGYYVDEAQEAINFDKHIEILERKKRDGRPHYAETPGGNRGG